MSYIKFLAVGFPVAAGIVLVVAPRWPNRPPRLLGVIAGLIGAAIAIIVTETIW